MLIDSHCHLDFDQFDADREAVIERAAQAGVGCMVNIAADIRGAERSIALAERYPCIFAGVGIHPHYAAEATAGDIQRIEQLSHHNRVVAVGEIGLDYYDHGDPRRSVDDALRERQHEVFCACIDIALMRGLPIVIHCRQANDDMLKIIRKKITYGVKAVMHCFSGDKKFLLGCLDAGMYVSFTANITYPKAETLRALIAETPLERMLIETDSPFLSPQAMRGKRNEPAFVGMVAQEIARVKMSDLQEIADATTRNARAFFGIKGEQCPW